MKRPGFAAGLLACAVVLSACDYEKNAVQEIAAPLAGTAVKFFNFGLDTPPVNFYANDAKITAVGSLTGTEAVTGVLYGGAGAGGFYSSFAPGQYTLAGKIAAETDKNLAISSLSADLADGKYYSFYQSGKYNSTSKTVESFVVEDNLPAFDYTVAYVRFVHAIFNANPMTLYAKDTTTAVAEVAVGGSVAYKNAGAFTALPPATYNLSTRYAGLTTNALIRNTVTFARGRVYTITARGDITVASTSATTCLAANRTCLADTFNR